MSDLPAMLPPTPLAAGNAAYVEAMYERFLADPAAVDARWQEYFLGLGGAGADVAHGPLVADLARKGRSVRPVTTPGQGIRPDCRPAVVPDGAAKQGAVSRLIQIYANRGHLVADIDPLGLMVRPVPKVLGLDYLGLSEADLETEFLTGSRNDAIKPRLRLREIIAQLKQIYCGTIGAEFAHVSSETERLWLQDRFQVGRMQQHFSAEAKKHILWGLTMAEGLERYLATRYPAQKRFSLEGGDSLIPLLDDLIQSSGAHGVEDIVIGMAHRGRLNVLVNVLGKVPEALFSEFEGNYDLTQLKGSGDVKYHKGFSCDVRTPSGNVHVALAFNPSHLEVVNPVVEGSVRARQERRGDSTGVKVMPVLIHGDSAFAGQGVIQETLQMSQARAFSTGGTLHVIVNNQVGFTTHDPRDTRSTLYCSDVAKLIEAPILHVNGDDPESVVFATRLALEYRMKFHKDVVIDLVCYRRLGHNEADEPAATQPVMYAAIRAKPTTRQVYAERIAREGAIAAADAEALVESYRRDLDDGDGQPQTRNVLGLIGNVHTVDWSKYHDVDWTEQVRTGVALPGLKDLGLRAATFPEGFTPHRQVQKVFEDRRRMAAGQIALDWGFAETLAYATLLDEGYEVRLTGQDSGRGTFFHRHAVGHEQRTGATYVPLRHLKPGQPRFRVTDSLLSEEAVLGFEYGYATTDPNCLVIWEAQFGDFANGAQVIIDQFISSGEAKWGRYCGLTLFLPHGFEGQGPEHSSARLERFLQLCAENNMIVCVPSTPAQMFHLLRRQMLRDFRKPLVVMTPKSLLRHKLSVSSLEDLSKGFFCNVVGEIDDLHAGKVGRVVFCSGKVYFDLLEARRAEEARDVAIVRIEQLYPFPSDDYEAILKRYPNAQEVVWCQEEPQNQGAWFQIRHRLREKLGPKHTLMYCGRGPSAAPATGIPQLHARQQQGLVRAALTSHSIDELESPPKRLRPTTTRKNP
jgi:2-oxoglutarate dehydrogenase E1 component